MLLGYQAVVIDILLGYYNKAVEVERVVPVDDEDDVPALISTAKFDTAQEELNCIVCTDYVYSSK